MTLVWVGLLIIGVAGVMGIVWSRPARPRAESGVPGVPDEGGRPMRPEPPADGRAKPERPHRHSVRRLGVLLVVGLLATLPVSVFTWVKDSGIGPGAFSTEAGRLAVKVQLYGMPGFAVMGLLGGWLVGYKARPVWLTLCLAGLALAAVAGLALPGFLAPAWCHMNLRPKSCLGGFVP